ncbi:MAG: hypothetical protein M3340_12865, partial [Actinomycetota bacterium]|nr:hypothetical protein [Actinomycetota bacterium]
AGAPLVAALQPQPAIVAIESLAWAGHDFKRAVPAPGTAAGRGGKAESVELLIQPGRYVAWVQGSFGPGVRLYSRPSPRENRFLNVADVFNDLGAPGWHRLGVVDMRRRSSLFMIGIDRPWWLSGSEHFNIMGPLEIRPEGAAVRMERIAARDVGRLCGRRVDWVEVAS